MENKEKSAQESRLSRFFKGVRTEFRKIIWPDRTSVAKQTVLIIIVTIILGVIIKLLDTGIQALISLIA